MGVEFSMARQWSDTAILSIFSDIDVDFCFHVEYFPLTIFLITYQYKSSNNWVYKMWQMWNFCGNGKSVTMKMNNWICARWEAKGSCSSKLQLMTLTKNALVLHITHQPAKPVDTNNTSQFFAAEPIKAGWWGALGQRALLTRQEECCPPPKRAE